MRGSVFLAPPLQHPPGVILQISKVLSVLLILLSFSSDALQYKLNHIITVVMLLFFQKVTTLHY